MPNCMSNTLIFYGITNHTSTSRGGLISQLAHAIVKSKIGALKTQNIIFKGHINLFPINTFNDEVTDTYLGFGLC